MAVVAIEEPTEVRLKASPALFGIVARIRAVAEGAGLRFVAVCPAVVRERLCGSARATRREMTEKLVERFPCLGRYQRCSSRLQEEYWMPMFSAVEVGVVLVARRTE